MTSKQLSKNSGGCGFSSSPCVRCFLICHSSLLQRIDFILSKHCESNFLPGLLSFFHVEAPFTALYTFACSFNNLTSFYSTVYLLESRRDMFSSTLGNVTFGVGCSRNFHHIPRAIRLHSSRDGWFFKYLPHQLIWFIEGIIIHFVAPLSTDCLLSRFTSSHLSFQRPLVNVSKFFNSWSISLVY